MLLNLGYRCDNLKNYENKHRIKIKEFETDKNKLNNIEENIISINNGITSLDKMREKFTIVEQKRRAILLDMKEDLENKLSEIKNNYNEMDYYDKTGDLLLTYYNMKENDNDVVESKNILTFLSSKKVTEDKPKNKINKSELFEKYCQITEGIRVNPDDGSKRIKYCLECKIEKMIIMDEDIQIKDYSPYKRLNRFREWLNAFQAKQTPEIDEQVYKDIIEELNKRRITDLSIINRDKMRGILKKLKYNHLYEHTHYIINKLSGLPPPKITRDMEKMFIRMFLMIQEPWAKHKPIDRKNFLSYGYVLHKFCELLELDHLLDCFPLHKQLDILMENDTMWKKICNDINWDFISSFK